MGETREIELLGDRTRAVPAGSFPAGSAEVNRCGLYVWWGDEEARGLVGDALGSEVPALLYVGKAGGALSKQTLLSRIRGKHLRGTPRTSTLRHSLMAILMTAADFASAHPDPWGAGAQTAVTAWMAAHLHVAVVSLADPGAVEATEAAAIARFDPPLNLSHVATTAGRRRLRALRRRWPRARTAVAP